MNMKISIPNIFTYLFLLLALFATASCSDLTDQKTVDIDPQHAKEQNPELWARYMEALRTYRQSEHFITYGSFDNGTEKPKNEGAYLRSLPDSLDIVTPTHPESLTSYDCEDILLLQEKSIKVLYLVDYTAQMSTLTDAAKLGAWLDKAIATASQLGMNGFAIKGTPLYGGTEAEQAARREAAKLIVSKLSAGLRDDDLLIFEGDPAFVDTDDLDKLDYVVLNTATIANAVDLKLYVTNVIDNLALAKDKLLLSAKVGSKLVSEEGDKLDAVANMTDRVISVGPLGGLAIYNLGDDYFHTGMNYEVTRKAIQMMNSSR
ncbi:glycoside hydrolase family 18 [Bacteroides finegoldii]|uniref:glycoside hydrolase family 18 n=1 Tax=Bacteroides finegoldii TaxID=338188 RepID=UPI0018A0E81A|nr:glycoside hydrolase family 18 [Bacteroides finegoldii]